METTYRPAPRVPAQWIGANVPGPEEEPPMVSIPDFDEDEATMAVAAVEALLTAARLEPAGIARVMLRSHTGTTFAAPVAQALGLAPDAVMETGADESDPAPGDENLVVVDVDAPRPGGARPRAGTLGAYAAARLIRNGATKDLYEVGPAARSVEKERVDRMAEWERKAPQSVPMAAYVPRSTWDAHATARARLVGSRCSSGHVEFPPRAFCGRCRRPTQGSPLPRPGHLETFTIVGAGGGPSEFDALQAVKGSYAVGVAAFGPARVPGLVTDVPLESLRIGLPVRPVFRRLYAQEGAWRYGAKFEPL